MFCYTEEGQTRYLFIYLSGGRKWGKLNFINFDLESVPTDRNKTGFMGKPCFTTVPSNNVLGQSVAEKRWKNPTLANM